MQTRHSPHWRNLTILAQDPSVKDGRALLRARVPVPFEEMGAGPTGYRVQVVDYDSSSDTLLHPWQPVPGKEDQFQDAKDEVLLEDPKFHQQNVYAIVMRTLCRFEHALGRRVSWSFGGHQLKVCPHAFTDANAFYSKEDEGLFFGYFQGPDNEGRMATIFSCLSHDVIAHETTHALLDGLRRRYTDPSSPDQAAFHEGFSDIVAILSVFSLREVVEAVVRLGDKDQTRVKASRLTDADELKRDTLWAMAQEMGAAMSNVRGKALRHSTELKPRKRILQEEEFQEAHRRGEVLVAAVLNAMIEIWAARARGLAEDEGKTLDLARVVDEGRLIADRLLTMSIRALDYCPPVHLEFSDYLSALLTADREINPDDSRYHFREELRKSFAGFGISPASKFGDSEAGVWGEPEMEDKNKEIVYDRTHFESLQRDPDEMFRFIWENRAALGLWEEAYSEVQSVRPCVRVGDDGFILRETVAEYVQVLRIAPTELKKLGFHDPGPKLLPRDREVFLYGGGVLIFDEYGRLKFHIHNRLKSDRQDARIKYFAATGYYELLKPLRKPAAKLGAFGLLHLSRSLGGARAGSGCGCHPGLGHNHED